MSPDFLAGRRVLFVMAVDAEYGEHLRRRITPLMTGVGPVEAALVWTDGPRLTPVPAEMMDAALGAATLAG